MFVGSPEALGTFLSLVGLGLVFVSGAIVALFFKIIGMKTSRAVLWGFGVPFAGFAVIYVLIVAIVREPEEEPAPIYIPYPPNGLEDDGE